MRTIHEIKTDIANFTNQAIDADIDHDKWKVGIEMIVNQPSYSSTLRDVGFTSLAKLEENEISSYIYYCSFMFGCGSRV